MESDVAAALELLLTEQALPRFSEVRSLVVAAEPQVPAMTPLTVDLGAYDALLPRSAQAGAR